MNPAFMEWAFDMHKQALDESFKQWNRLLNAPTVTEHALQPKVASTPHDVVYEKNSLQLYHYRRESPAVVAEPVLICYALVNRPYILDLQSERSVVRRLLEGGLDVYLIDWGVPTAADKTLGLQDYICGSMRKVADVATQIWKGALMFAHSCDGRPFGGADRGEAASSDRRGLALGYDGATHPDGGDAARQEATRRRWPGRARGSLRARWFGPMLRPTVPPQSVRFDANATRLSAAAGSPSRSAGDPKGASMC